MKTFKLREEGVSHRVYCTRCYAILGVDHPSYCDNVFLNFPAYCRNKGDLTRPLTAYIFLDDLKGEPLPPLEPGVPLSANFKTEKASIHFDTLPDPAQTFCAPKGPPKGITFAALIKELGPVTVLGLERGRKLDIDILCSLKI